MKILFLCTGNACRSQIAEGFAREYWPNAEFYSAGIEAHGIDERAIKVMLERKIDISEQDSNVVSPELLEQIDMLVSVCAHAEKNCPVLPVECERRHWPLQDPAKIKGNDDEVLEGFRRIRDEIQAYVVGMGLQ
ncbi:MAG: arsenate reductase [Candidatus Azotimanducaceae bacterium]|jgi:arsenate reductase